MYTQGDWQQTGRIIHSENGNICSLADPRKSDFVGDHPVEIGSPDWQEAMDNGKLIKAAPALLKACEAALAEMRNIDAYMEAQAVAEGKHGIYSPFFVEEIRQMSAAIAEAKGEAG